MSTASAGDFPEIVLPMRIKTIYTIGALDASASSPENAAAWRETLCPLGKATRKNI